VRDRRRRFLRGSLAAAIGLATRAHAQTAGAYPARPLKLIVPFRTGGAMDSLARALSDALERELGVAVVVQNRPGAGGNIGYEAGARSAADGYTIVLAANGITINAALGRSTVDPMRDLDPIAKLVELPILVTVSPSLDVRSLGDLFALARREPGRLSYATNGVGTTAHVAAILLTRRAGVELAHVPYGGNGSLHHDLLSGEIPVAFSSTGTLEQHVRSGRLVALAVTSRRRVASLPDVPTVAESGFPGFEIYSWYGAFVPAGTPAEVTARLGRAFARAIDDRVVRARLDVLGMTPAAGTSAQFRADIRADVERWTRDLRDAGATFEPQ
jgi:tripartite-type tricarboxylate transporter receptor subunit TctC